MIKINHILYYNIILIKIKNRPRKVYSFELLSCFDRSLGLFGGLKGDFLVAGSEFERLGATINGISIFVFYIIKPFGLDFERVTLGGPEKIVVINVAIGRERTFADFGEIPDDVFGINFYPFAILDEELRVARVWLF